MDFSGQYLTYNEYKLLGGALDIMPFNLSEFNARKILDRRTQNRLAGIDTQDIPQEVKLCINEMIKALQSYDSVTTRNKAVSSETTDGYSVSYNTTDKDFTNAKNNELEDIMGQYLGDVSVNNVPILFLGVC